MGTVDDVRSITGSNIVRPVICVQGGGTTSLNSHGDGWNEDVCFTLNALDVHGVAYEIYKPGTSPKRFKTEDCSR